MKTRPTYHLAALIAALMLQSQTAGVFAQGSLTPAGAPAPTMKTLDQIEPRTAITNTSSLVTISQPGSYYLTHNLTVASGDGIDIITNGVKLDLNGFTISSTSATASGTAILLNGGSAALKNITILNGSIQSGFTNNGSGTYSGGGFDRGIEYISSAYPSTVSVSGCNVSGCYSFGIDLGLGGSVVEACKVKTVGSSGIVASVVRQCVVKDCGGSFNAAIYAEVVSDSEAEYTGYGSSAAISAKTVQHCLGLASSFNIANSSYGISGTTVINSEGDSYGGGTGISAAIANNSYGSSSYGTGLVITDSANNCSGHSPYGIGISMGNYGCLNNCAAKLNGTGIVMGDFASIFNCVIIGNSSNGVVAGQNCVVRGCTASGSGSVGTNGVGIIAGIRSTIEGCTVNDNRNDGINAAGDSVILNNHASHNGLGLSSAAGIHIAGAGSRIEGNQTRDNSGYGIKSDGGAGADIIIRNASGGNGIANYSPTNGNYFAPVQTPINATNAWGNL